MVGFWVCPGWPWRRKEVWEVGEGSRNQLYSYNRMHVVYSYSKGRHPEAPIWWWLHLKMLKKKKKRIHVSVPQWYQLFSGPSESNEDAVSVEMTLSLGPGFLLVHKCHVSLRLVMTLLRLFFGGNDYCYFCTVFLTVFPYSEDKWQLCITATPHFQTAVNLARPRASSLEGGPERVQTCFRALSRCVPQPLPGFIRLVKAPAIPPKIDFFFLRNGLGGPEGLRAYLRKWKLL